MPTTRIVPPPLRRGQGWWFAIPRSSAAGDKNASQTPYKHRLAHASGSRPLAFRAGVPVRGFLGRSPKPLLGTFGGAKVPPRRTGVQIKTFYKTLRRREATTNFRHNRLQICCSLLLGGRIIGRSRNQGGALSCRSPPLTKTTTLGHFRHSPPAERPPEKGISRSAERDQGSAFGNRKPFVKGLTQNFYITSGAVIFRRERTFSSTVAVARHRAARAAQTAWSSHFTRQFW